MLNREKEIVLYLLNSKEVTFDDLKQQLNVSRRTLYYDLSKINTLLKGIGEIVKVDSFYEITGDRCKIEQIVLSERDENYDVYLEYDSRKEKVLLDILAGKRVDRQTLAMEMYVSETTIAQTIKKMKTDLQAEDIQLFYDDGYQLGGNEIKIREYFLQLIIPQKESLSTTERVERFNLEANLELTDYSKMILTSFLRFIDSRYGKILKSPIYQDAVELPHYTCLPILMNEFMLSDEAAYLSAFISTLPSLKSNVKNPKITRLVDALLLAIEQRMLINFRDKDECRKNISRHLQTSFNRIKYQFPVLNPLTGEIKLRYEILFRLIKNIFQNSETLDELSGIRDEEIAFLVSYIGAYIERDTLDLFEKKRVVVVCPNGITVTKTLQYQLENYFPQLEITGALSLTQFMNRPPDASEWIVSTVKLEGYSRVIRVNPILRNHDLALISQTIYKAPYVEDNINVEVLVETFRKYGTIKDEAGLTQALYKLYHKTKMQKGGYLMLKDLLVRRHIKIVESVEDWQMGIKMAAEPLLEADVIDPRYVEAMIDGVNQFGPYIVLTDYFAFAHSRPENGVKELSMSMLKVNEPIDMMGKPVKIIVVLAASDNTKHLKALSSLTELFMHEDNVNKVIDTESVDVILELIEKYS